VTDTEAASHRNKDPAKVLRQQEEEKKRKYLIPCQQAHKHFTPLVYSVDGLEGKEAAASISFEFFGYPVQNNSFSFEFFFLFFSFLFFSFLLNNNYLLSSTIEPYRSLTKRIK